MKVCKSSLLTITPYEALAANLYIDISICIIYTYIYTNWVFKSSRPDLEVNGLQLWNGYVGRRVHAHVCVCVCVRECVCVYLIRDMNLFFSSCWSFLTYIYIYIYICKASMFNHINLYTFVCICWYVHRDKQEVYL